jgi:hypothetical protein
MIAKWSIAKAHLRGGVTPTARQIIQTGKNDPMIFTDGARLHPMHTLDANMTIK